VALATIIFHGDDDPITPGVAVLCSGNTTSGLSSTLSHAAALAILAGPNITPVTWHAIGGGQAGFDGSARVAESSVQGPNGGEGGSWATADLDPATFTIQIGTYGAANGDAGGDTWVKFGGVTQVLARGGGSASTNVGTSTNVGGLGNLVRSNPGMGGNGGGGAGGPDGPGGDTGNVSPTQHKFGAPATTTIHGGLGGGAGNGGKSGYKAADAGTFHVAPTFNIGGTSERIAGDGGDSFTPPQWFDSVAGSAYGSFGGQFGNTQSAFFGAGGPGGPSLPSGWTFSYVNDSGFPGGVRNIDRYYGAPGGYGAIWGLLPADWTTGPVPDFSTGSAAGPGGGGGGGGGGNWDDDSEFPPGWQHRGWPGGGYGAGGGAGGDYVTGNVVNAAGASGNSGILVAIFDDAVASEGVASCCEDPVIVDEAVVALLSQKALRVAHLVQFDFLSVPKYLWNGSYDLTVGGHTWSGLRNLGGIEGLEESSDLTATQMRFTLSGVNADTLAIAVGDNRDEYVGRTVTVWLQFFDSSWQPVGTPVARSAGLMDGITISRARNDEQNSTRVLTLTAENIFAGRGVPPAGNYTDADQRFRSPTDRGLSFINEVQNTVVEVPW
jgi:hypothetical protein